MKLRYESTYWDGWHIVDTVTGNGAILKEVVEEYHKLEQRLLDKDKEILRLRREADKVNGLRMGEIR